MCRVVFLPPSNSSQLARSAMASFDEETANKLITQVEFYFSDSNLPTDGFLRKEVAKSKDGLVSLPLVCSFSRMRNLLGLGNTKREDIPTSLVEEVANLLRASDFLKVSDNGQRIGRGTKLSKPDKVLEQVHRRTIAASPFEYCIKMEDVASFFSQYAKVNSVRLPHHIGDKQYFCGTALVELSSEQEAEDVLRQSLVYSGAELVLLPKSDFDRQRENLVNELGKTGSSLSDSSHNEFHRGQIVKFTLRIIANAEKVIKKENPKNLENEITGKADSAEKVEKGDLVADKENDSTDQLVVVPPWENSDAEVLLKDVFGRFGSVKHIEFSSGSDWGYVCFIDSETAMKARAAVELVGGLVVKNKFSIALEAVNGEIEGEVWKRLSSGRGEEEDDKMEKSKGKCSEATQPHKKARKER
ncbi:la protein 2 [Raphanus sativus]|uniref:La protein 2 n=1 Tax=Raphanus sativus TaxID=3726 RepID=A0A6J0KFZ7_RAPSA|nr:la protein 2 [Raphanus sativus]